jgi:putative chitinase
MPYDRKFFFDGVRTSLFGGTLSQSQVDGMNYLLEVWEWGFEKNNPNDGTMWLAYALATFYWETGQTMQPIEEYGKGSGKSYGQPAGPHGQCYYGRGHVQLTWEANYKNGQQFLKDRYGLVPEADPKYGIYPVASNMLDSEVSALISYDGMVYGWFTGVGLPKYLSKAKGIEDPVNARRIVNGTDQAQKIAGFYWKFKEALKQIPAPSVLVEAELPGLPEAAHMPEPEGEKQGERSAEA